VILDDHNDYLSSSCLFVVGAVSPPFIDGLEQKRTVKDQIGLFISARIILRATSQIKNKLPIWSISHVRKLCVLFSLENRSKRSGR